MKNPEQIFDEAIKAKGLDIVSVKDADLYEAGLDAIKQALSIDDVVEPSEQLVCDIHKGTRCSDSFPSYKDGKCHNCGGQAN